MFLRRLTNYLFSLPKLIVNVSNFPEVIVKLILFPGRSPVLCKLKNGPQINLYTLMDLWTLKEVYLDRDYEKYSLPLQNGWTVMDIGAAFGDFSLLASAKYPKSKVYSYEPYPKYFDLIKKNIQINKAGNIFAFPSAVGSSSKPKHLDVSSGEAVMFTTSSATPISATSKITVPSITLAEAFKKNKLKHCDFLKLDCEAGEYEILFNAPAALLCRINHICMEYHDQITSHTGAEMARYLTRAGFTVQLYPNQYRSGIGYLYARNNHLSKD